MFNITKLVHEGNEVTVTLSNGVTVHLSFRESVMHAHFSGIRQDNDGDPLLVVSACMNSRAPSLSLANNFDVGYKPSRT